MVTLPEGPPSVNRSGLPSGVHVTATLIGMGDEMYLPHVSTAA